MICIDGGGLYKAVVGAALENSIVVLTTMSGPLGLPSGDQILRYAVRGTAGVIGLASEGIHARKERKQHEKELKQQKHDGELSREDSSVSVQSDTHAKSVRSVDSEDAVSPVDPEYLGTTDELWELDSAQDQLIHTEHTPAAEVSPDDVDGHVRALEDSFLEAHKDHGRYPLKPEGGHLDLPVIVPQRRPQNRARGFVRAYAPELEKVGIDCDMWLNFLDTFETASQASPWLNCINFAGFAGMAAPHPVSFAISVALTLAVKEVMDLQSRQRYLRTSITMERRTNLHRINKFLLKINEEFFQPRGLFCLVMTWKPDSDQLFETVDINATINSAMTSYNSGFTNKFKQSQGTTYGDWGFPEAAPLVFPTLDIVAASDHEEAKKFKDKVKKKANFVANYYDKRATAKFVSFILYSVSNLRALATSESKYHFTAHQRLFYLHSEIMLSYKSCTRCVCMLIGLISSKENIQTTSSRRAQV